MTEPERPTQPQEPDYDADARYLRVQAQVEADARTCAFWAVFDDCPVAGLNTIKIEAELHLAWQGGTVRHPLRGVAQEYVEAETLRRFQDE